MDDNELLSVQINFLTMKAHASVMDDVEDGQEDKEYIKFSVDYTWFRFIVPQMT